MKTTSTKSRAEKADAKELIFVNQSSGYLMIDIIRAFDYSYTKTLLAGTINPRGKKLDSDVTVIRIAGNKSNSLVIKLLFWIVAFIQTLLYIRLKGKKAHIFLVSNPPLNVLMPLFFRNKFSLLIYDVFPDILVEKKILGSNSYLLKLWIRANRKVFARASQIFTISTGMKSILTHYTEGTRIKVVPVWTDNTYIKPLPAEDNIFIKNQKLEGRFLVTYSGNIGETHDVEILADLAYQLRDENIYFLVIGNGFKLSALKRKISENGIQNLRILPWQDTAMLPYSLSAADIGVVSLNKDLSKLSVPSKTYDLLAAGVPLLCIAGEDSELCNLMNIYKAGKCFRFDDQEGMKKYILDLYNDKQVYNKYRQNALNASEKFTSTLAGHFTEICIENT